MTSATTHQFTLVVNFETSHVIGSLNYLDPQRVIKEHYPGIPVSSREAMLDWRRSACGAPNLLADRSSLKPSGIES